MGIDRDGSTDRGKEDNDEGKSGHEGGMKEMRARRNDGDSESSGLKVDSSSARVGMGQERTKKRVGVALMMGRWTGVCAE